MKQKMRHLLILVPGITGSELVRRRGGEEMPIWSLSGAGLYRSVVTRGKTIDELRVEEDDPERDDLGDGIVATRLIKGFHQVPGLTKCLGYGPFCQWIRNRFEVTDDNFIEFPYDWRRDNRVAARRLRDLVDGRLPAWRERSGYGERSQVILLAHSMGGLVSRYYLECLGGWRTCRALVTFGTPFRGSPNALQYMARPYKVKKFGIQLADLTETLRSFTSVYQLLPRYPMIADPEAPSGASEGEEGRGRVDSARYLYPKDIDLPHIPGYRDRATAAFDAFHTPMDRAQEANENEKAYRHGFSLLPFAGVRQRTLQSARFEPGGLEVGFEGLEHMDAFLARGDGTVPLVSAKPVEMNERPLRGFTPQKHATLFDDEFIRAELADRLGELNTSWEGFEAAELEPAEGRGMPALSLEVDDLYRREEPVELRARVFNADDPGHVEATFEPLDPAGGRRRQARLDATGDEWRVAVEGLEPGAYRVTVETFRIGPRPVEDLFEVAKE